MKIEELNENNIYDVLASLKSATINRLLRWLNNAKKLDTRMNICDLIIAELDEKMAQDIEDLVKD